MFGTLLALIIYLAFQRQVDCKRSRKEGEFLAGTFILTQKSLSEAPYRYAGVLRKALDKAELKDPPSKSDEENCDVKYRIRPSGRKSTLRILENTLSITLKENNTIVIGAKIYAEVTAKTWIWKGMQCIIIKYCLHSWRRARWSIESTRPPSSSCLHSQLLEVQNIVNNLMTL